MPDIQCACVGVCVCVVCTQICILDLLHWSNFLRKSGLGRWQSAGHRADPTLGVVNLWCVCVCVRASNPTESCCRTAATGTVPLYGNWSSLSRCCRCARAASSAACICRRASCSLSTRRLAAGKDPIPTRLFGTSAFWPALPTELPPATCTENTAFT